MMKILVKLFKDRVKEGTLLVVDEHGEVLVETRCLGRADTALANEANNPTRDPLRNCGDTPTGTYNGRVDPPFPNTAANLRSYGPLGTIALDPIPGQALLAKNQGDPAVVDDGHRAGLRIHGGALGVNGRLRPTKGCVRNPPDGQKAVLAKLGPAWQGQVEVTETST